jgi:PIN domain nuclease of toxin-antitoxin system
LKYLLDTNAWIWMFSDPGKIRKSVRDALNREERLGLSPLSIVEVAQKSAKGRLDFSMPLDRWVTNALPSSRLTLQPLTAEIALRAYQWPTDFHGDPADRLIAATAVVSRLILVTSDEKLLERTDLQTLSTR